MLEQTTAFITGSSRGIGRQMATEFANEGARVVVAARGDDVYRVAERIGEDRALAVQVDITDEESVANAIETTVERFGCIDCLVNNAGIIGPTKPLEEVTSDEWQETFDVNITGMYLTSKYAIPHLRRSERGRIINVSSSSWKLPVVNRSPYNASKIAVLGLTWTLAYELGEDGITANVISPGPTNGPRIERSVREQAKKLDLSYAEAKRKLLTDDAALGRIVDPEDIAHMAVYLASDRARYITAEEVSVNAGNSIL